MELVGDNPSDPKAWYDPWQVGIGRIIEGGIEIVLSNGYDRKMVIEVHPEGSEQNVNDRVVEIRGQIAGWWEPPAYEQVSIWTVRSGDGDIDFAPRFADRTECTSTLWGTR